MVKYKLPFYKRMRLRIREIFALWHAKKEEKKHIPTKQDILKGQKKFEHQGELMRRLILKKKK